MDTSYRTCPNQSAPLAPKWAFLHLSKWHHHSSHCSRQHFLIPYIKPNSKFCWLLLWKRSWLQAFLPNPSASTLVEAPMTFHGDSAISTQSIQLSPVPFYSPFPHIAPGVPLLAWSSHAPSENPAVPPPAPGHSQMKTKPLAYKLLVPGWGLTLHLWSHLDHLPSHTGLWSHGLLTAPHIWQVHCHQGLSMGAFPCLLGALPL